MTVTDAELAWVTDAARCASSRAYTATSRGVETQRDDLDCRRTRLYGEALRAFVDPMGPAWLAASTWWCPERLFTAPLPVVAAYLRSMFQAEGYVSAAGSVDGGRTST